jgi:hypothetical protein
MLLLAMSVGGCTPIQQIDWESSNSEIRIAPETDRIFVTILTKTTDPLKQPSIDPAHSFAVHEGRRYPLLVKKNDYVDPSVSPWNVKVVLLTLPNGKPTDTVRWEDGKWDLHLEFAGQTTRDPIDARFVLWTAWYSPLFPFFHWKSN